VTDDALHRLLLEGMREIRTKQDEQTTELREIRSEVHAINGSVARLREWQDDHEEDHGTRKGQSKPPSPWIANSSSWAWAYPRRTALTVVFLLALLVKPVRMWLIDHIAWAFRSWW